MKKIKEIIEERAGLKKLMDEITDKASLEKRDLTTEENKKIDELIDKSFKLQEDEKRAANMAELQSEVRQPVNLEDPKGETVEERGNKELRAFRKFIKSGQGALTPEDLKYYNPKEQRASTDPQSVTTDAGGYLVPTMLNDQIVKALKLFGGAREYAKIIQTDGGYPFDVATIDDTSNKGRLLGINTQVTVNKATFGKKTMYAFKFSSDEILIPTELLQDEKVDFNGFVVDMLAERIGRIENDYYTTGTGSNEPEGFITGGTASGVEALVGALTKANLIDLQYSVDPLYRRSPSCCYQFNDLTAKALFKLSLGTAVDFPLFMSQWGTGNSGGLADKILGYPYVINQSMANIGAGLKSVAFGDFSRFWIRDVAQMRVLRLTERYADYDQIAIIVIHRTDSRVITSGAIKHLYHSNT